MVANHYYHVYNRGNDGQLIFYKEENYKHFLKKYKEYISGYCDTFAYALLPNHFHAMVKVKEGKTLVAAAKKDLKTVNRDFIKEFYPKVEFLTINKIEDLTNRDFLNQKNFDSYFGKGDYIEFCYRLLEWIVRERFRRFFMAYAKAINKQEDKDGSLFQKKFKRKLLETTDDFRQMVLYIHRNPIHHGMAVSLEESSWTSYPSFFSKKATTLKREAVLEWFDDLETFKATHERYTDDWRDMQRWCIED